MRDQGEADEVRREVADRESTDPAALRRGDGGPRREEDDRPDDRKEHPEQRLDPVLRGLLQSRDEQRAVDAEERHRAVPTSSRASGWSSFSPEKTRSMTSSIGGSSSERSASESPRSRTRRAVVSAACARGTRIFTWPFSSETT